MSRRNEKKKQQQLSVGKVSIFIEILFYQNDREIDEKYALSRDKK